MPLLLQGHPVQRIVCVTSLLWRYRADPKFALSEPRAPRFNPAGELMVGKVKQTRAPEGLHIQNRRMQTRRSRTLLMLRGTGGPALGENV